ncbi:helix-turn-helix domain-containing protein [Candidatus Spongiihabitans sp.]|uniref:helix-turn-helix domain-containing protein n=1 Tax=Candidatus Spongiihabitans sp. TaxID=3101308 RepID=UPI003C7B04FD
MHDVCLKTIGWSKATYYRWLGRYRRHGWRGLASQSRRPKRVRGRQWTAQQEQQVLHLRKRYPLWGKRKLWKVLFRDRGLLLSISTVGRILDRLVRLKRVKPAAFYYGRVKPKCRCQFKHHAKRWTYGMRARRPGERVQIDHMSVGLPAGFSIKEFKAACPAAGFVALKAYSRATSRNAKDFLICLIEQAPFKIRSIQVDGGSEFRDEFEQACEALDLPLLRCRLKSRNGMVALSEPMAPAVMSSARCMKER